MRVLILGAGISGHTAALLLRKNLGKEHEVVVVSPNSKWNWIPSNIWVGVGKMTAADVTFQLADVYKRAKIKFHQASAKVIHPEGTQGIADGKPYVEIEYTSADKKGQTEKLTYDYLINATGPRLNFGATPGMGPEGFTHSVCTFGHAEESYKAIQEKIQKMKKGEKATFVVGTGHGTCTCEGAAFEYVFNLDFLLRSEGVRENARVIYLTNEPELGDFGVGGMHLRDGGFTTPGHIFAESFFVERNVDWVLGAHVRKVTQDTIEYETISGEVGQIQYDYAMLIPPFGGVPLKAFDKMGAEITADLFSAAGFMKVDANYTVKSYEEWEPEDWPKTYQTKFKNVFAIGIAFAPPHQISKPHKNPNGVMIAPAPPRTGMPSAVMGRAVAKSIVDMIKNKTDRPSRTASMAELGAACVASSGADLLRGSAVSITMFPIIPDYKRFPETGRDLNYTTGEIGLAGHWIKTLLHYAFMYKAKAYPFWWIIPE